MAADATSVVVASWNILAPIFVRTDAAYSAFEYASDDDLSWPLRAPRIVAMLLALDADVVALQELQLAMAGAGAAPTPEAWMRPLWDRYHLELPEFAQSEWDHQLDRNTRVLGRPAVTCVATLWKRGLWERVDADTTSRGLVLALRHAASAELFAFANVHLEGHPDLGDLRRKQLHSAVRKERHKRASHLVCLGDFNQEDSCCAETGLTAAPTGASWCNGRSALQLDHITVEGASLRIVHVLPSPYDGHQAIPNALLPSDHAPIACRLAVIGPPVGGPPRAAAPPGALLSEERRRSIAASFAALQPAAPLRVKGKPTPEQLAELRAHAEAKRAWVQSFGDATEAVFAKALADGKIKV